MFMTHNVGMSDLKKQIGLRIKELREAKGLTQSAMATELRKSIETISNMERGKVLPGLLTIDEIATKNGISLRDFFNLPMIAGSESRKENLIHTINRLLAEMPEKDLDVLLPMIKAMAERK